MDEIAAKKVKDLFGDYLDLLDNRKTINTQVKEVIEQASTAMSVKKSVATKLFSLLKKKSEGSEEFDVLANLLIQLDK